MSGDRFETLIADGVDRIALPPESEWLPGPARTATRELRPSRLVLLPLVAAVLVLAAVLGAGLRTVREQSPAAQPPPSAVFPTARCPDGRPQSEIDFAGRMLWEPTATEISCVLNATVSGPGANRAYRLTDGRVLNTYERVETLPVKPTVVPIATGTAEVNGATWSWSILPAGWQQTLLLQGSLADAPYVELSIALSDEAADLRLLRSISASLRQVPAATPSGASPTGQRPLQPPSSIAALFDRTPEFPGYKWTRDGKPVDSLELSTIAGPAHCSWQTATMLQIGWPPGTVAQSGAQLRMYIRDPRGVMRGSFQQRLVLGARLPSDARPTGYRYDVAQIYLSPPDQDEAIYVVGPDGAERWPRSDPLTLCS